MPEDIERELEGKRTALDAAERKRRGIETLLETYTVFARRAAKRGAVVLFATGYWSSSDLANIPWLPRSNNRKPGVQMPSRHCGASLTTSTPESAPWWLTLVREFDCLWPCAVHFERGRL